MVITTEILTADEAWVGLALLHRRHPERESFSAKEIMEEARKEKAHPEVRAGLQAHIYLHNVANLPPNSARYRMFYRVAGGGYRLFRPGDESHPDRKGKAAPRREELPKQYHHLLTWYENHYSHAAPVDDADDPVLQMWGVGKEIWADEGGDAFIARERAAWVKPDWVKPDWAKPDDAADNSLAQEEALRDRVWNRIVARQNEEFQTSNGVKFTYTVEGDSGIWFYRAGRRINMPLARSQVNEAISLCPVTKPAELSGFRDHAYLFGLLTDHRIHASDW